MADVIQHDLQSFPRVDPATAAAQLKQANEEAKAKKEEQKASATRAKKAVQTPTVKEQLQNSKERDIKLLKLELYFDKLGHKLGGIKKPKVWPREDEEVNQLLLAVETHLASHGGITLAGDFYLGAFDAFERVTQQYNPLQLHLSGPACSLAATVEKNRDKWDELVTEFAIAHAEWFMMGPGKRLIGFSLQMVKTVDGMNKAMIMEYMKRQQQVPKEKQEEVADL